MTFQPTAVVNSERATSFIWTRVWSTTRLPVVDSEPELHACKPAARPSPATLANTPPPAAKARRRAIRFELLLMKNGCRMASHTNSEKDQNKVRGGPTVTCLAGTSDAAPEKAEA